MKKQIGQVSVDSGSIWVGDPCYVLGEDSSSGPEDWAAYCTILDNLGHWSSDNSYIEPFGHGVGMYIQTTWGDGTYPVIGKFDKAGRLTSVTVNFDGE